jgi:hypothetical protein
MVGVEAERKDRLDALTGFRELCLLKSIETRLGNDPSTGQMMTGPFADRSLLAVLLPHIVLSAADAMPSVT